MNKYRVLVRGENFLMNLDGIEQKVGFYVTRFMDAENEDAAEGYVMDQLRTDPQLKKGVLNEITDTPMMYAEEVEKVESSAAYPIAGRGFTFYPEKGAGSE